MIKRSSTVLILTTVILIVLIVAQIKEWQGKEILISGSEKSKSVIVNDLAADIFLDDGASVAIPANVVSASVEVSIMVKTTEPPVSPDQNAFTPVGKIYQIDLGSDSLNGQVMIRIPYDPGLLPDGIDPQEVALAYFDENNQEWNLVGGTVDSVEKKVSIQTSHASDWLAVVVNWDAWIAILKKTLTLNPIDIFYELPFLIQTCPQQGTYSYVDPGLSNQVIQGCIEAENPDHATFRIANLKSFYIEIFPIRGGIRPERQLLRPGQIIAFDVDIGQENSPRVIAAEITQKAGWYTLGEMLLSWLPGGSAVLTRSAKAANCFIAGMAASIHIQDASKALFSSDEVGATRALFKLFNDVNSIKNLLSTAEKCRVDLNKVWTFGGISRIASLFSTSLTGVDLAANAWVAGNIHSEVSFNWGDQVIQAELSSIVYIGPDGNIWITDLGGQPGGAVTERGGFNTPALSPGLDQVAFIHVSGQDIQLGILNLSSKEEKILLETPNPRPALGFYLHDVRQPRWSPDGQWIYFYDNEGSMGTTGVSRINIKTGKVEPVGFFGHFIDISKYHGRVVSTLSGQGVTSLFTSNIDGADSQEIVESIYGIGYLSPRWSPNGSHIAVVRTGIDPDNRGLLLISLDGKEEKSLLSLTPEDSSGLENYTIAWIPDGSGIYFVEDKMIKQLNIRTGKIINLFPGKEPDVQSLEETAASSLNASVESEEYPQVQLINSGTLYLTYNPAVWETGNTHTRPDGVVVEDLLLKQNPNCILEDNLGFGPPSTWGYKEYQKEIGNLLFSVENYYLLSTGYPQLVIYQYHASSILHTNEIRIQVAMAKLPEEYSAKCIESVEEVLLLSGDAIANP